MIDSETEDDEAIEVWNESEEIIDDIKNMNDTESEPEEEVGTVQNESSKALTRWLLTFLMFMQAVYHLSDTVITSFLHFFSVFLAILGRFCSEHESVVSPQVTRPARINYFAKHVATINGQTHTYLLVSLSWFSLHPKSSDFGKPVMVCYYDVFEVGGIHSLVPIM